MNDIEGKGFVIKDKRAFTEDGDLKEETTAEESPREKAPPKQEASEGAPGQEQDAPLPEVNFSTLIMSLSSSAFFHLGEIPDPGTGEKVKNLALAKQTIDIIGMLKEKTKGNLDAEEENIINNMLTDLRLRYVKASK